MAFFAWMLILTMAVAGVAADPVEPLNLSRGQAEANLYLFDEADGKP